MHFRGKIIIGFTAHGQCFLGEFTCLKNGQILSSGGQGYHMSWKIGQPPHNYRKFVRFVAGVYGQGPWSMRAEKGGCQILQGSLHIGSGASHETKSKSQKWWLTWHQVEIYNKLQTNVYCWINNHMNNIIYFFYVLQWHFVIEVHHIHFGKFVCTSQIWCKCISVIY